MCVVVIQNLLKMVLDEKEGGRTPLGDLTNISSQGTTVIDAKERRRQRDRAKRASMSAEERSEINKKRRESYQLKKGQLTTATISKGDDQILNNTNIQPPDDNDWLHYNMSYQPRDDDEELLQCSDAELELNSNRVQCGGNDSCQQSSMSYQPQNFDDLSNRLPGTMDLFLGLHEFDDS